ncbi:MAG: heat shock protein Hsp20 [Solirubrobacterales bacterium]|jgi:HSP20 family protein|nr:heat shock protein Hsp20 [Solirubrobacterales bacterium]
MALPTRQRERASLPARRSQPMNELDELQEQLGRLFESVWTGAGDGQAWSPPVDVEETDDAWIIEAELPGVRREDVNVEVRESEVMITGEIKERERAGILRRRTRRVGAFEYRVALPNELNADAVEAKLKDGVLTVRVPKAAQARPRRIDVKPE